MKTRSYACSILLFACAAACSDAALAQIGESQSPVPMAEAKVASAEQARYAAKGLPLGAFRLFPAFAFTDVYDDNVFRKDTGRQDDFFVVVSPALDLVSQWSRHMIEFKASLDHYEYRDQGHEDRTNFDAGMDGRLDLLRGLTAEGSVSYRQLHELRTSQDLSAIALTPALFKILHADGNISRSLGKFSLTVGGSYDRYRFDPTKLAGGVSVSNKVRNRRQYEIYAKAGYEFSPGYAVFLRGSYNDRSYELKADTNGFDRDSNGYRIDAGFDVALTRLIEGNVFAGYLHQSFKSPLSDVTGVDYGVGLDWYPAELVTVHLKAQRIVGDTTLINASSNDARNVKGQVDYAFRRNVVVEANAGYENDDFSGSGRTDKIATVGAGAKYLANEYLLFNLKYDYTHRSSGLAGLGYSDNTVMLGVGLQL